MRFIGKTRYLWLFLGLASAAVGVYNMTQLELPSKPQQMVETGVYEGDTSALFQSDEFPDGPDVSMNMIPVLLWGVLGLDLSEVALWDVNNWGTLVEDPFFEQITTPSGQEALLAVCTTLLARQTELSLMTENFICPMSDFKDYLNASNITFPVQNSTEMQRKWATFLEDPTFGKRTTDQQLSAMLGSKILYYAVYAQITVYRYSSNMIKEPIYAMWTALKDEINARNRAAGVYASAVLTARSKTWGFMRFESALFDGSVQGVTLAMGSSFLVLLLFTRSLLISIYAVVTISGILLSIINVITIFGWTLGIVESLSLVIVIGFSIDYVIHVGHAYLGAKNIVTGRIARTTMAVMTMAPSVSWGAATTLVAGFPLILTKMTIFYKMGILMVCTVSFALVWTLFFFVPLLLIIGPVATDPALESLSSKSGGEDGQQDSEQESASDREEGGYQDAKRGTDRNTDGFDTDGREVLL